MERQEIEPRLERLVPRRRRRRRGEDRFDLVLRPEEHPLAASLDEIGPAADTDDFIEYDENGFPCLKRSGKPHITSEQIYQMLEDDEA